MNNQVNNNKHIVELIIQSADYRSILCIAPQVCKFWKEILDNKYLWVSLLKKDFDIDCTTFKNYINCPPQEQILPPKKIYKNCILRKHHLHEISALIGDHFSENGFGHMEQGAKSKWGLGGSMAGEFYGIKRLPRDIDFIICTGDTKLCYITECFLEPKGFKNIGKCNSELTDYGHNWCFDPTGVNVDLCATGGTLFSSEWDFSKPSFVYSPENRMWYVSLSCLITMKLDTGRYKDIEDVKYLIHAHKLSELEVKNLPTTFIKKSYLNLFQSLYPDKKINVDELLPKKEKRNFARDTTGYGYRYRGESFSDESIPIANKKNKSMVKSIEMTEFELDLYSQEFTKYDILKEGYPDMYSRCGCSKCLYNRYYNTNSSDDEDNEYDQGDPRRIKYRESEYTE